MLFQQLPQAFACILFLSFSYCLSAQVGIGTSTPSSKLEIVAAGTTSATTALKVGTSSGTILSVRNDGLVEVNSVTRGFLPPRMTTDQREAIVNPELGSIIYNTSEQRLQVYSEPNGWIKLERDRYVSVGLTTPTGLTVTNSPVTYEGTMELSYASGYSIPTTSSQSNWDEAFSDKINSATISGTTVKTLTLTKQSGGTLTTTFTDDNSDAVSSVFGRTGAIMATTGDYTTAKVTESGNLYFTDARARSSISVTNIGTGGAATYSATTGEINIPQYQEAITNPVTGTGAAGKLAFWAGTSSLTSSSNLVWDNTNSRMGVGTASPHASSIVEMNSTTQGFLPPRMTYSQRNAILAPAQGLVVYCTNCGYYGELQVFNGIAWTNMVGQTPAVAVGQAALGGVVVYIFPPGHPNYVEGQVHGLVAATADIGSYIWSGTLTATGTSTAFGTGQANTNAIIASGGSGSYAAKAADDYSITSGGVVYNDWYLPSRGELAHILQNASLIGGFASAYYWSSSEYSVNEAYCYYSPWCNCTWLASKNGSSVRVRPIRTF